VRDGTCASDVAGGRLVLTNVPQPHEAEGTQAGKGTSDLRFFTINHPKISVARAAALSANFPPIFSDAAIDEWDATGRHDKRFWVTDGGTVENRGAVTLYLSIEDALDWHGMDKKLGTLPEGERKKVNDLLSTRWPPLHVVIADVSAVGGPYKESYGLQSVQSAGGQMGLALEAELLEDLSRLYMAHGSSVTVHELPMPAVLRDGIGTHWMIPDELEFTYPGDKDKLGDKDDQKSLSKQEVLGLVRGLFGANDMRLEGDVMHVRDWTCHVPAKPADEASISEAPGKPADGTAIGDGTGKGPLHAQNWEALTGALGVTALNPCADAQVAGSP
jgi:hypothetical protein